MANGCSCDLAVVIGGEIGNEITKVWGLVFWNQGDVRAITDGAGLTSAGLTTSTWFHEEAAG